MGEVDLGHGPISTEDLAGDTLTDYLVNIEADLILSDDGIVLYHEPLFPVLELAVHLNAWLSSSSGADFEFTSMSFEESGVVSIRHVPAGWLFGSCFAPLASVRVVGTREMRATCRRFLSSIRREVGLLGFQVDEIFDATKDFTP